MGCDQSKATTSGSSRSRRSSTGEGRKRSNSRRKRSFAKDAVPSTSQGTAPISASGVSLAERGDSDSGSQQNLNTPSAGPSSENPFSKPSDGGSGEYNNAGEKVVVGPEEEDDAFEPPAEPQEAPRVRLKAAPLSPRGEAMILADQSENGVDAFGDPYFPLTNPHSNVEASNNSSGDFPTTTMTTGVGSRGRMASSHSGGMVSRGSKLGSGSGMLVTSGGGLSISMSTHNSTADDLVVRPPSCVSSVPVGKPSDIIVPADDNNGNPSSSVNPSHHLFQVLNAREPSSLREHGNLPPPLSLPRRSSNQPDASSGEVVVEEPSTVAPLAHADDDTANPLGTASLSHAEETRKESNSGGSSSFFSTSSGFDASTRMRLANQLGRMQVTLQQMDASDGENETDVGRAATDSQGKSRTSYQSLPGSPSQALLEGEGDVGGIISQFEGPRCTQQREQLQMERGVIGARNKETLTTSTLQEHNLVIQMERRRSTMQAPMEM